MRIEVYGSGSVTIRDKGRSIGIPREDKPVETLVTLIKNPGLILLTDNDCGIALTVMAAVGILGNKSHDKENGYGEDLRDKALMILQEYMEYA